MSDMPNALALDATGPFVLTIRVDKHSRDQRTVKVWELKRFFFVPWKA